MPRAIIRSQMVKKLQKTPKIWRKLCRKCKCKCLLFSVVCAAIWKGSKMRKIRKIKKLPIPRKMRAMYFTDPSVLDILLTRHDPNIQGATLMFNAIRSLSRTLGC